MILDYGSKDLKIQISEKCPNKPKKVEHFTFCQKGVKRGLILEKIMFSSYNSSYCIAESKIGVKLISLI